MTEGLTTKQRLFVEEYLTCWNATEAARRAGYADPNGNARRLTVHDGIRAEIQRRLTEKAMAADEVLARLTDHATIDADDFLFIGEEEVTLTSTVVSEQVEGEDKPRRTRQVLKTETVMRPVVRLDLRQARARGKLHLIKEIKDGKDGLTVKLHDAQAALSLLGKHHGLFVERHEHSWRDQLKQQGHDPDAIKQQLVAAAVAALTSADRSTDERGDDGGANSG